VSLFPLLVPFLGVHRERLDDAFASMMMMMMTIIADVVVVMLPVIRVPRFCHLAGSRAAIVVVQ